MTSKNSKRTQNQRKLSRIPCNRCGGPRIHELKFTHHGSGADPDPDFYYEAWTDELWVCCGCEMAALVHHWELVGAPPKAEAQPEVHLYPPRTLGKRQSKYFIKLPPALAKLYRETVETFNAGSMLLCTIGLRALIEGVCKDKGIKGGKLKRRSTVFRSSSRTKTLSIHSMDFDLQGMMLHTILRRCTRPRSLGRHGGHGGLAEFSLRIRLQGFKD